MTAAGARGRQASRSPTTRMPRRNGSGAIPALPLRSSGSSSAIAIAGDNEVFTIEDEAMGEGIQLHFYADSMARITTARKGGGGADPEYRVEYSLVDGIRGYRKLVSAFVRGGCAALDEHGSWMPDAADLERAAGDATRPGRPAWVCARAVSRTCDTWGRAGPGDHPELCPPGDQRCTAPQPCRSRSSGTRRTARTRAHSRWHGCHRHVHPTAWCEQEVRAHDGPRPRALRARIGHLAAAR